MDWRQLWEICSAPDNVPIVGLIPLLAFYIYLAVKQARANDQLIEQLEADPAMAKTHHRKTWPFKPGWAKEVHVWPFLLRIEFLAAIIITIILMVWSITLSAPLEEPANPNLTMNPAKAPWYFLGLQELLHYFPPVVAGVLIPTLVIVALIVIPYFPINIEGHGIWLEDKKNRLRVATAIIVALCVFLAAFDVYVALIPTLVVAGFMFLAAYWAPAAIGRFPRWLISRPISFWIMTWFLCELVVLTAVGTFFRGPGWSWVWPWEPY
jgi:hypothetical protein